MNKQLPKHLIILCISVVIPVILNIIHSAVSVSHHGHIQNLITFILMLLLLGELLCLLFDKLAKAGPAAVLRSLFPWIHDKGSTTGAEQGTEKHGTAGQAEADRAAAGRTKSGRTEAPRAAAGRTTTSQAEADRAAAGRAFRRGGKGNFLSRYGSRILFAVCALVLLSFFFIHSTYKFDKTSDQLTHTKARSVKSGSYLDQTIRDFEFEKLSAVNIKFGTYNRENEGTVTVELRENGTPVASWTKLSSMLTDNAYQTFELDSLLEMKEGGEYVIHIEEEYEEGNDVAVWINGDEGDGYIINGEPRDQGTICYTLTYRNTVMKGRFMRNGVLIGAAVFILILLGINETALMAFILALLMIAYSSICPPLMAPDEVNHFRRAYEVAEVGYVSEHMGDTGVGGNVLPQALNEYISYFSTQVEKEEAEKAAEAAKKGLTDSDSEGEENEDTDSETDGEDSEDEEEDEKSIKDMPVIPINWDETVDMEYGNTALYSPISYLPQAIGIRIASVMSDSTATIFYAGRAANAIFNLLLCILALCIVPFGKRILFLIMTFPLSLQEMISMSPDGFTISLSIFFLALILKLCYGVRKLRPSDLIVTGVSAIVLSQLKIVYVVLLLMIMMIPLKKFRSPRQGIIFKIALLGAAAVLNVIWLTISSGFLVEFNPGVDTPAQVAFVIGNIGKYYCITAFTLLNKANGWLSSMIGSVMGAYNITTTGIVWISGLLLFVCELLTFNEMKERPHKWDPLILIVTFLLGSALVVSSLYVQWTPLMNPVIEGVQGRYFTPLLGLFAFFVIFVRQAKMQQSGIRTGVYERKTNFYLFVLFYNSIVLLDMMKFYIADIW